MTAASLVLALICLPPLCTATADETPSDVGMFVLNFEKPFVSRGFAEKLARLVMTEKLGQAVLAADAPDVQDKNENWLVTFKIAKWNIPDGLRPMATSHVSLAIRKADGAIVSVK